ncbi:type III restriction-modification system-like protein [Fibrobacter succinogenes subsp. succinogenes S85]|uniref:Type III restriction protein res subunit n=1 Tax=Fibrobacter succinogenes (strain ATCC 19169 / S85) TaxID=59374 RepID=C9RS84_FIBSS|nr:DEAD/DEAH box helicase family protein [Fibrobacter succinogenes]ACX75420.1 type III restriction protein res subunit [Fibrobacter succinogenes subsp. succinogenes S85]ADL25338.1 type III restriction-modification system-like protein [Fibrobacter succinogenes subsp. succinogenes S85]
MKLVDSISKCLSLRKPQKVALEHLSAVVEKFAEANLLKKDADIAEQLKIVQQYQQSANLTPMSNFDHSFSSMTFDMATGVGKTRLMGAFIAYLYKKFGLKNYLIVAPNTTIYEKLIADFTSGFDNKKYVFRGLDPLGWPSHRIITGDNYNSVAAGTDVLYDVTPITVNIFNIAKLTEKQSAKENHLDKSDAAAALPRVRRISEFLGDSYFNILLKKEDLVVIMDEAHHYRAKAGYSAIDELHPVLGLELTATPTNQTRNILYSYDLPQAMHDGFVKVPAVACRRNFNPANFTPEELEHLKLKEADLIHSNKKVALKDYEFNHGLKQNVKPFIFVISKDIAHAKQIEEYTQSKDFCNGKYKDKVLRIDSSSSDEEIKKLLMLEHPLNPYEIVIHCNKLGEGWDVTNLYTIVPLRAANELHLIMQSIGRGLRLPYGKRVGDKDVDQVVVISHDNFDKVIEEAKKKMGVLETIDLGPGTPEEAGSGVPRKVQITMKPKTEMLVAPVSAGAPATEDSAPSINVPQPSSVNTPEVAAGKILTQMDEDAGKGLKPNLNNPVYVQTTKDSLAEQGVSENVAEQGVEIVKHVTIDIPRITLTPKFAVTCNLDEFTFDGSEIKKLQPIDNQLLIQTVLAQKPSRYILKVVENGDSFDANDFVTHLMQELSHVDGIDYDSSSKVVYDVANQVKDILLQCDRAWNIVANYFNRICEMVKRQLLAHRTVGNLEYETRVEPGYVKLQIISGTINEGEKIRDFRDDKFVKSQIKSMAFNGFEKCLYDVQKFDSDPERKLMVGLESDETLQKWFRATQTTFRIPYGADGSCYTPDIIMETANEKIMCEVKAANKMKDEEVLQKAAAGKIWCERASTEDSKPWKYVLISEEEINQRLSLDISGLLALGT